MQHDKQYLQIFQFCKMLDTASASWDLNVQTQESRDLKVLNQQILKFYLRSYSIIIAFIFFANRLWISLQ